MRRPFSVGRAGVVLAIGTLLAVVPSWFAPVQASVSPLSEDAEIQVAPARTPDRTVLRSRWVALDVDTLPDPRRRAQLAREPNLTLELFPDVFVEAVFDRFDANDTGVTWVGHLASSPLHVVTLVYGGGVLTGTILSPQGMFQIRPASDAVRRANPQRVGAAHEITQVDQSAFMREADPIVPVIAPEDVAAAADKVMVDSGAVIDVMIVYTSLAQTHAGGAAALTNLINLSVSETNTSYRNSGVAQRIRVVHTVQTEHVEVSDFGTNLSNLRAGTGTGLGGIAALRNQYGADLVAMLIHPVSPTACGIAYVMTSVTTAFAPNGYSVTDTACLSPNFTLPHELGHNMGAQHDWFVSQATLPYTYAHGFVSTAPGRRWRSIMSYNDACTVQGFSCGRLLAWSNPDNQFSPECVSGDFTCRPSLWRVPTASFPFGVPGGTRSNCLVGVLDLGCDQDDRRALNNTAVTVANLRASVVPAAAPRQH
jgi:hypothetical protein